jgi:nucleoside-diphosphate-sugar epimerase
MTDFRSSPTVTSALHKTNYHGTENVLFLIKELKLKEFIYIGTCYSRGHTAGVLPPDFVDLSVNFRNSYEKSKLEAECLVRKFCKDHQQRLRVFRPSTICGRLIEAPFGAVTKFDVFYSWVAWCLRMKLKMSRMPVKDIYQKSFSLPFRIACREDSGLNIVPADYAAKVIFQVCDQQDPGESYYLVNNEETLHRDYVKWMLEVANVSGTTFVRDVPGDLNDFEVLYYKTIGLIFTPYVSADPMLFDIENLKPVLVRAGLACPVVDKKNFMKLMVYAKISDFGLKDKVA